jgi:HAD superfamily hydrolase (TIGR01509 family)
MNIRGILFDFFGVICSEVAKPWFEKYGSGMTYQEFRDSHVYPYDAGKISDVDTWSALARISDQTEEEVKKQWVALAVIDMALLDYVKKLSSTHKIALVTNAGAGFFWSILDANHIRELFPIIVVSSEEKIVKPDPRIYQIALMKMELLPEEVLFIDDRKTNLEGARSLGIQTLEFSTLSQLRQDLSQFDISNLG